MDYAHQLFYAERELTRHGIDPDEVDLHALLDTTLTYGENRRMIVLPLIYQRGPTLRNISAA